MALTQARSFGAYSGKRYGSFLRGDHPVDKLTQARAFGAHTGQRYNTFGDKGAAPHPVGKLTQLRAFGAHTGQRYGQFGNKVPPIPPVPPSGPIGVRRVQLPFALIDELRFQRLDEDDILLIIAAQIASNSIH